jgi:hypothetical protein
VSVGVGAAAQAQFDVVFVVHLVKAGGFHRHLALVRIKSPKHSGKHLTWTRGRLSQRKQDAEDDIPAFSRTFARPLPSQLLRLIRGEFLREWACLDSAANGLLGMLIQ